jgi:hypothetical protein
MMENKFAICCCCLAGKKIEEKRAKNVSKAKTKMKTLELFFKGKEISSPSFAYRKVKDGLADRT